MLTRQDLSYWSGDGKNWKAAWSSESGNHILKWPPLCIASSPAPSHFISTAPLPGVASNSAFPHPPAFPIAPDSSQKDVGTWGIFEFLIIFHTPSWGKFWENRKQELTTASPLITPMLQSEGWLNTTQRNMKIASIFLKALKYYSSWPETISLSFLMDEEVSTASINLCTSEGANINFV